MKDKISLNCSGTEEWGQGQEGGVGASQKGRKGGGGVVLVCHGQKAGIAWAIPQQSG